VSREGAKKNKKTKKKASRRKGVDVLGGKRGEGIICIYRGNEP